MGSTRTPRLTGQGRTYDRGVTGAREATAFHEAGHLVAAVLRGGSWLTSTTLETGSHTDGMTWWCAEPDDRAFIILGGPWAQARHSWQSRVDAGEEPAFDDELLAVLSAHPEDAGAYSHASRAFPVSEREWGTELTNAWPAMAALADVLLRGEAVTLSEVRAAVASCARPGGTHPDR